MKNGELLRKARKKIGWTQQDLADYFEVDQPLVARWEINERPIPKQVLKMARTIRRTNKKTAEARFKRPFTKRKKETRNMSLPHIKVQKSQPQHKTPLANTKVIPNSTYLQGGFCSQSGGSVKNGLCLEGKKEKMVLSPPEEGSMEHFILESYIEFKKKHKRFPTGADFINRKFKETSKEEVLQYFGELSNAKKLAGKLKKHNSTGRGNLIRTFPSPTGKTISLSSTSNGFPCCCCGKRWRGAENFYYALRNVINNELNSADTNGGAIQKLKTVLFDSPKCFCGGDIRPGFKSSFKSVVLDKLNKLDETGNTAEDCRKAIFGQ